jgi:hypothetical protein
MSDSGLFVAIVFIAGCEHANVASPDAASDSSTLCREIDAGTLDTDIVDAGICSCLPCVEGQHTCVVPTLGSDGHVTSIAADPTTPISNDQLACISAALVGRCLSALTGASVCEFGV